ncbi:hypothetical protein OsJ_18469 [Oryza sativa Japonica Group]|uniref:chitinase n=1 Tax=Oryza sativa subsp. japonica TaxID=39947 RepID=B9FPH7_ORYSJ|nr:hypothetical protein OsJ_18469 [Oryza sativa Japonica Group]
MIAARAANLQVAMKALALAVLALAYAAATARAEQCGRQAGGARCPNRLCCSRWGWCGLTDDYCKGGCQSQCRVSRDGGDDDVAAVLLTAPGRRPRRRGVRRDVGPVRAHAAPPATTRRAPPAGGPYSWGYCYKEVKGATSDFCVPNARWPCAPGKAYHARGPMQIAYNYNYGAPGEAIAPDLLGNPELWATDSTVAFKTALWLWMTARSPSQPSPEAVCAGGNGGADRVAFYKRYCDVLGVGYGPNLDCFGQAPFDGDIMSASAAK